MDVSFWVSLSGALKQACERWWDLPGVFWAVWWPVALMTVSAYPLVVCWSVVRKNVASRLDRWFLAPIFGMAYYTLLFMLLNALFHIPIGEISFYVVAVATCAAGYGWIWQKTRRTGAKKKQENAREEEEGENESENENDGEAGEEDEKPGAVWWGKWEHGHWAVLAALLIIFWLSGAARFAETLKYPHHLLDSDPYRHYPRTEWIVRTGVLNKWEPWLVGQVPIFEMQGCYVMAALLARAGHVDTWTLWKYGSVLMGTWSAVAVYILGAYFLPGRPRRLAGLLTAAALSGFSVFISRTNCDFSEPWGLVFIPPALLAMIWSFRFNSIGAGVLHGILFLALASANMVPNIMLMVFLAPYCLYQIARRLLWDLWRARRSPGAVGSGALDEWRRRQLRAFGGLGLGVAVFMAVILVWDFTYSGVPLVKGASAHRKSTQSGMERSTRKDLDEIEKADNKEPGRGFAAFVEQTIGPGYTSVLNDYLRRFSRYEDDRSPRGSGYVLDRALMGLVGLNKDLVFGTLALLLLFLVPACASSQNGAVGPKRPFLSWLARAWGDLPAREWADAKVFLFCFYLLPLLNYVFLPRGLFGHEIPTFTEKIYRYLLTPSYCLAICMGLAMSILVDIGGGVFGRAWAWARGQTGPSLAPGAKPLSRSARRALARKEGRQPAVRAAESEEGPSSLTPPLTAVSTARAAGATGYARMALAALALIWALQATAFERPYGNWPPTSTAAEDKALGWICDKLPEGAFVLCNWFNADFVRTHTVQANKPMNSIFAGNAQADGQCSGVRDNIRNAKAAHNLDIPTMTSIEQAADYARKNPGNYYIMKTRWGPSFAYDRAGGLIAKIASFSFEGDTVTIWALKSNPAAIEPYIGPEPIGGCEAGSLVNLEAIADGSLGKNRDNDAARVNPIQTKSHWAWFGLKFPKPRAVSAVQTYLGIYMNPKEVKDSKGQPKNALTYVATEYVFQYWDGKQWADIPDTHKKDNDKPLASASFAAITTDQVRVYVFGERNDKGEVATRGAFRACCLEFDVR